ncbi:hypothetical protein [Bilophila wadsworthia]|uniref:hypothetical protein n=1 Tax=Bilophila wadsworthia TaxID=35833 RepID=UPI0026670000|nr:hypothetical protein [Bilophila wadsworthia]
MRKEFPPIPPVLKSSEALRMLFLDRDDYISHAVMAAEHLRLLNEVGKDFVGCDGIIVALDELTTNLDNVRSTLCPKEDE